MITRVIKDKKSDNKLFWRAVLLGILALLMCGGSLLFILLSRNTRGRALTARLYQNGVLLREIDLSAVREPYLFTVDCPDGGSNTVSVRPGAIGICDADCPDRLCVKMGYADAPLLPIVCLPHGLVIELSEKPDGNAPPAPDAVSY